MLKKAFNLISRIHSREAVLKRMGTPDLYSPIRITQSNFFRYLEGPSQIVIRGREFVIPVDTMLGTLSQRISFSQVPTAGTFTLSYGVTATSAFDKDSNAAAIQAALRAISGLSAVTVTGSYAAGFVVVFYGVNTPSTLTYTMGVTPLDATITISQGTPVEFSPKIKRGDKIIDATYGHLAIDEIIEMIDIGGEIMGYRVRTD